MLLDFNLQQLYHCPGLPNRYLIFLGLCQFCWLNKTFFLKFFYLCIIIVSNVLYLLCFCHNLSFQLRLRQCHGDCMFLNFVDLLFIIVVLWLKSFFSITNRPANVFHHRYYHFTNCVNTILNLCWFICWTSICKVASMDIFNWKHVCIEIYINNIRIYIQIWNICTLRYEASSELVKSW